MPKRNNASKENIKRILRLSQAHQRLLSCALEDDVEGMEDVLEQKIDINYVQAFFRNDVRYEHSALIIALQKKCSGTADFLIKNGADVNQALSLAFIYFSEEISLQSDLISKGADIEKAFQLAVGHDWDDERQEKWGKARILWLALAHQPENVSLHAYLTSEGADINRVLWLVLEKQSNNDEMISNLISKKADLNRTLWLVMKEEPNNSVLLISLLVSKGGNVEQALKMAIEKKWSCEIKVALIPDLGSQIKNTELLLSPAIKYEWPHEVQEGLGEARILLLAFVHQPDNASLHAYLTSQGAKINIALCLVMVEQPDNRELMSRLIAGGADIEQALKMAVRHVWDDEAQERLGKAKLFLLAFTACQADNRSLFNYLISQKANIHVALWLVIEEQTDNRELMSRLIAGGAKIERAFKMAIEHNRSNRIQARWYRAKVLLLALSDRPKYVKLHRDLISKGAELDRALCLAVEKQPDNKDLISRLISMGANLHRTLYLIMAERPDNKDLISNIIAMGAELHRALCLVLNKQPNERELISRMIGQGADIEKAFRTLIKHDGKDEQLKDKLLWLALTDQPENASLHAYFVSNGADVNRTLWLAIERQPGNHDLISRLISIGADLNQTLCLVLMQRPDNIELISHLIAQGADIKAALIIPIGNDWKDKEQEMSVKASLLLLALKHQPENRSLHLHLTSQGADASKALGFAVEDEPGNDELISGLISYLVFIKADLDRTLSLIMRDQFGNIKLVSKLVSQGANIERAFRIAIEDQEHFWTNREEELSGKAELLLSALRYQPENVSLHAYLISRGTEINRTLYFAVRREMDDELISKLTSQGANINITLCMVVSNKQKNKRAQSRLISMGADVNDALSVIVEKVSGEYLMTVVLKLISQGADINKALYFVLKHDPKNDKLISELISNGSDLNEILTVIIKESPGDDKMIASLIFLGADPSIALLSAVDYHPGNDLLVLKLISLGAKADYLIDRKMNGHILHLAIDRGCSEKVIHHLLQAGANPNEKIIITRSGCEQIGFGLVTLTNPMGWFYLSYLFCARGDCGSPFTEKHIDAMGLARLKHNVSAENAIVQYRKEKNETNKRANSKTPLLRNEERRYGAFFSEDEKRDLKYEEVHLRVDPLHPKIKI